MPEWKTTVKAHENEPAQSEARLFEKQLLRAKQIYLVQSLGIMAVVVVLSALGALISLRLLGHELGGIEYGWFGVNVLNAALMYRAYRKLSKKEPPKEVSGRLLRVATWQALFMGLLWAVPVSLTGGVGNATTLYFCVSLQVGLSAGFAALLSPAPRLVMSFAVPCCLSAGLAALSLGAVAIPYSALAVLLIMTIFFGCRKSERLLRSEIKARHANTLSHENLEAAIEAMTDGFVLTDKSGAVLKTNTAFREKLDGQINLKTVVDKQRLPVSGHVFEVRKVVSEKAGNIFFLNDVTSQTERQTNLERAVEEAEAAERSKTRFLESMSHELKSPLDVVIAFSRLMSSGSQIDLSDEQIQDYSSRIQQSGEYLMRMLDDIIAYAQMGIDHATNTHRSFSATIATRKAAKLACMFEKNGDQSDVRFKFDKSLEALVADPLAFERIIVSLVSNAVRYGGAPSRVLICGGLTSAGAPYVSVRDWGQGIDEAFSEQVFEPFFKCASDSDKTQGAGLGLTISRQLARAHGGDILIQSRKNAGCIATLVLPADTHIRSSERAPSDASNGMTSAA